jgi:hypothetical protein
MQVRIVNCGDAKIYFRDQVVSIPGVRDLDEAWQTVQDQRCEVMRRMYGEDQEWWYSTASLFELVTLD